MIGDHRDYVIVIRTDSSVVREALIAANGLREAARHCKEGQTALHTRLICGAEVIERLCRSGALRSRWLNA
jgi:hypothetical protein